MSNSSCLVLVPVAGMIDPHCEQALAVLGQRGYTVRKVRGYSAIDYGRCDMATKALDDGFEELMWIDSDIAFHPDEVEKLRNHKLPFACGIYAKKTHQEFACDFLPDTEQVKFGQQGGLHEICYDGFGFTLNHRQVFEKIRSELKLPRCNTRFRTSIYPFFLPMLVPDGEGMRYLSEDFAFCERARQCGFRVMADTSIRLWHVGTYGFGWEDVGTKRDRFASLTVNMKSKSSD